MENNICILSACELVDGKSPIADDFRKACVSCESVIFNEDGTCSCKNEKVMERGRQAVLAALPEGYEIENLVLKPYLLKKKNNKCSNYSPCFERIFEEVKKYYI